MAQSQSLPRDTKASPQLNAVIQTEYQANSQADRIPYRQRAG